MSLKLPDDTPNTGMVVSTTLLATGVATGANVENVRVVSATGADVLPPLSSHGAMVPVSIEYDAVGSVTDTDDGSIAAAQANVALVITMPHTFDGANWVRGGWTPAKLNSAATTNATSVKAAAGALGWVIVENTNAAVRYLKFYNKASAPTVGTDTPVLTIPIPGSTTGGGVALNFGEKGAKFTTGIAFALTTGATDADTGAVAANEILVNYGWL